MPPGCALPWPIMGGRGPAPLLQTKAGRTARWWTRRGTPGSIAPCCRTAIAATAQLLVGDLLLVVVRRPAPLFDGASDSDGVDYESRSPKDEVDFVAVALVVARPLQNGATGQGFASKVKSSSACPGRIAAGGTASS